MHHGELRVKQNSGTLYTVYTAVYMYVCNRNTRRRTELGMMEIKNRKLHGV